MLCTQRVNQSKLPKLLLKRYHRAIDDHALLLTVKETHELIDERHQHGWNLRAQATLDSVAECYPDFHERTGTYARRPPGYRPLFAGREERRIAVCFRTGGPRSHYGE